MNATKFIIALAVMMLLAWGIMGQVGRSAAKERAEQQRADLAQVSAQMQEARAARDSAIASRDVTDRERRADSAAAADALRRARSRLTVLNAQTRRQTMALDSLLDSDSVESIGR